MRDRSTRSSVRCSISLSASFICDSAPSARKSIFTNPASSALSLSHWQMYRPSMALRWRGTVSESGRAERIMPPGCCARYFGNPPSWRASRTRSCHSGRSARPRYSGSDRISAGRSFTPACPSTRFVSLSRSSPGSPRALPMSRMAPLIRYVEIIPVSTARSLPQRSWTRRISFSRMSRGKSRSMSGGPSISASGMKRSSVNPNSSGSMCERPIR